MLLGWRTWDRALRHVTDYVRWLMKMSTRRDSCGMYYIRIRMDVAFTLWSSTRIVPGLSVKSSTTAQHPRSSLCVTPGHLGDTKDRVVESLGSGLLLSLRRWALCEPHDESTSLHFPASAHSLPLADESRDAEARNANQTRPSFLH
jgi:hypothetical protein